MHRDDELIAELIDAARPNMAAIRSGVFPDWITRHRHRLATLTTAWNSIPTPWCSSTTSLHSTPTSSTT